MIVSNFKFTAHAQIENERYECGEHSTRQKSKDLPPREVVYSYHDTNGKNDYSHLKIKKKQKQIVKSNVYFQIGGKSWIRIYYSNELQVKICTKLDVKKLYIKVRIKCKQYEDFAFTICFLHEKKKNMKWTFIFLFSFSF